MTYRFSFFAGPIFLVGLIVLTSSAPLFAQDTRLLRQPTLSAESLAFAHGGDLWVVDRAGGEARRLTSTPAVERDPHFSPDGQSIAFSSNRSGNFSVYVLPIEGGTPTRLSWYPADSYALGWTPDGSRVLYASSRQTAPAAYQRLWTVSRDGGPSEMLPAPRAHNGSYSADGSKIVVDPVARWDWEWRHYRGGQNKALVILDLEDLSERRLPNERTTDIRPVWMDGVIYFLASTNLALASGWANTSTIQAEPTYAAYITVLRADDPTPFVPESDEESPEEADDDDKDKKGEDEDKPEIEVEIDFDGIERRTLAVEMPVAPYVTTIAGPEGSVFIGEGGSNGPGMTLHKFTIEDREAKEFLKGASRVSVSADGKKLLYRSGTKWHVVGTDSPPDAGKGALDISLQMHLDRQAEWQQIFDEAWRYERDYFYDPNMHGRDWDVVRERYAPLVPFVRHRTDLSYILNQMNGELSVGHSFVFGGDFPETDDSKVGLLGADLVADEGRWKIARIYTFESWNPQVSAPLDRPGLKIEEGDYIVAVDGVELTAADEPYRLLDGTAGRQTFLSVNDKPSMEGARRETVEPIDSERSLRQLAWVEDNRRRVDELSDGRLAYVWVPNTSTRGVISFNRYFFAQQDKLGAVIDERFNGGGLLDDYMVDLMTRKLRAAITNEVPNGKPFRLPAGILGPKVLLINELAGSGGDYFPWVFRQQQAGPLIGTRTWGGLVKSSVHYSLVDGGALTAPDNAVFDPINNRWIGENEGVPPDIEVEIDARSVAEGRDPQLERGVEEALRLLEEQGTPTVEPPPYPKPAAPPARD